MIVANVRVPAWRIVFDGQSLNRTGLMGDLVTHWTYPEQVMQGFRHPWINVAISGTAWADLATTAPQRVDPLAGYTDRTALIMFGGQSDLWGGATGQQVYEREVAYAEARRAAGYTHVVCLTTPPNTVNDPGEVAEQAVLNALRLEDPEGAFDHVVDVVRPPIDDPTNIFFYFDGLHFWFTGAKQVADMVRPTLTAMLAA